MYVKTSLTRSVFHYYLLLSFVYKHRGTITHTEQVLCHKKTAETNIFKAQQLVLVRDLPNIYFIDDSSDNIFNQIEVLR